MTRVRWTVFAPGFALVYGVLYALKQAVFIFYPLRGELTLERLGTEYGPGMLWYGWLAAGLFAGAIAMAIVPPGLAARVPPALTWLAMLAAMVLIILEELRGLIA
ncbi:MAG: hypothetical protein U1F31_15410 [Steroidobacteraceae bacterium]